MIRFLQIFGSFLACLPEPLLRALVVVSAEVIFQVGRKRRRGLLSNLRHAFPERDYQWVVATGRRSVQQMVEFALLAVALPCFSEKRLRKIFSLQEKSAELLRLTIAKKCPVVALAPHIGPQEGLALLPLLLPEMAPAGAIYRPIKNEAVDKWIRESRERFGVRLFSRKEGLQASIRLLRANEWLGLLFDQNSSGSGALITFLDRVASVTDLPGILAARHEAEILFLYAARRRFWRIELRAEPGPATRDRDEINFAANLWLEKLLRTDEELLPSWLWAHNRWRHQRIPELSLREKKNLLEKQSAFLKRTTIPRREPFFIRLPDSREAVAALLPLLERVRRSRPDASITAIGKSELLPPVQEANLCERALAIPASPLASFLFFRRLRRDFPSGYFNFADSPRSDLEAWLTGAPHRYAVAQGERRRRLLNRPYELSPELAEAKDRTKVWEAFLRANGLREE